jgi:hypothetical protein
MSENYSTNNKLRIFGLYHKQATLDNLPNADWLVKINLNELQTKHQHNCLGEGRAFLADLDLGNADYIGFANARWNKKYHHIGVKFADISNIIQKHIEPKLVIVPWPTNAPWLNVGANWAALTLTMHPSMGKLLTELSKITGMKTTPNKISFWANDFVCHRKIFLELREHWRKCFNHFNTKYGLKLPFTKFNVDINRHPAYFYERVTTIFFANKDNLKVEPIYGR